MAEENGQSRYVVMASKGYTHSTDEEGEAPGVAWLDVATVLVPPRTKRKTIVEKAFAEANLSVSDDMAVRVLDEESAREIPVSLEEQPPRLKIG